MFISTSQNVMPANVDFGSNLPLTSDYLIRTIVEKSMEYTMTKLVEGNDRDCNQNFHFSIK